jgi:hypothetical protein
MYGRFGWSDEVGPLWFLRHRWTVGPRWRSCWARFFAGPSGVTVQVHTKKGGFAYGGIVAEASLWNDMSYAQKEDFVLSFLRQVRRPDGPLGAGGVATDPDWVRDYPAIHEYVTTGANPDGSPRRTSTLTVFAEHGSFKVYLNERDSGASLCSSGSTVGEALTALEVMLEGESPPWRFSDRQPAANGRRGRRGS